MPSARYRANGRPIYSFCAVIVALAVILALVGSVQSIIASSVPKDASYADAIINSQGGYTITENDKYIVRKFEISGEVQGVSFRRYTNAKAKELGLTGWCRNTPRGTVEGEYEYLSDEHPSSSSTERGEEDNYSTEATFRHWLCNVGSPRSDIDGCTFSEKVVAASRKFDEFRIIR